MKKLLTLVFTIISFLAVCQNRITEKYKVQNEKSIAMKFDFPNTIIIEPWDNNEIYVTGEVNINGGKENNMFTLTHSIKDDIIQLEGIIKDHKQLEKPVIAIDGIDTLNFKNKEEFDQYQKTANRKFNKVNIGSDIRISLHIKVPKSLITNVESTYGFVELKGSLNNISVNAIHGGIEASINPKTIEGVTVETKHGKIFTDSSFTFENLIDKDFHTKLKYPAGSQARCSLSSTYGNIYLRKQKS